ncbi:toll/interleukin-1 receptor domain-containing protein [Kriegella aquimaris]|uniref:TIR domain-containing protein n=1 Tax=Kriegella aquimaris TaxID=192904 RepID=A0A1G9WQG5_9FLAO|nr:toll/interleukin-1 receptor domain-containing protein [Kriegella aquimaris]SDM86413.1 TIR domain-containing protein [Kriegella aquimaris]
MESNTLKIFISYSREDSLFINELTAGLEACGFSILIDKEDIVFGEEWQKRLKNIIHSVDIVILIISSESVKSSHVIWELQEALKLNKRIIPIVFTEIKNIKIPTFISKLNYCFFTNKSFGEALKNLSITIKIDIEWVREHTRLNILAKNWLQKNKPDELLLRGQELENARIWRTSGSYSAPDLTDTQADFITKSTSAYENAKLIEKYKQRKSLITISIVAVTMTALALFGFWQWQQSLLANEKLNRNIENLTQKRQLRIGVTYKDRSSVELDSLWFSIAYKNQNSVVLVTSEDNSMGTGFIINGNALHPNWSEEPVLVTVNYVLGYLYSKPDEANVDDNLKKYSISFPSVRSISKQNFKLNKLLYLSRQKTGGIAVVELSQELIELINDQNHGSEINPIKNVVQENFIDDLPKIPTDYDKSNKLPDWDLSNKYALSYASLYGRQPSLLIMRIAGIDSKVPNFEEATITRQVYMPHTTAGGSSGAPIIDANSGNLIGIHN